MPTDAVAIAPAPSPLPDPNDRSTFNARAYAHTSWQANELGPKTQQNAQISKSNADEAAGSATTSATKALEAAASATAAAAIAGASKWLAATNYAEGAVVYSPTNYIAYRRKAPGGVNATDPAADNTRTYWQPISVGDLMLRIVTATVAAAANGELLALTNVAATTVTAPAAPAAGDSFGVVVCNGLMTNVINWNGAKHMGLSDTTTTLDDPFAHLAPITSINPAVGWSFKP